MGKKKDREDFERGLSNPFYGPGKEARKMLDRYDVAGVKSAHPDGRTGPSRSVDDVKRDLASAMMKDYHTNESFQNAAHAGHKGAKKFAKKGFSTKNLGKAWDTYKDLKKEYVGGGGMMGAENIAGLTYETGKARDAANRTPAKTEIDGNAGLDFSDVAPIDPEIEEAKTRTDAYERRHAPEYFGLDGRANLRFSQTRTQQDEAKSYRDKFRDELMMSIKQPKVDVD